MSSVQSTSQEPPKKTAEEVYQAALQNELLNHPFARFYPTNQTADSTAISAQEQLDTYTHREAIEFIAMTAVWEQKLEEPMQVKAYYRLLKQQGNIFVLIACHPNVHATHRTDLRFVHLKLAEDSQLTVGDVVMVTKMELLLKNATRCIWDVTEMEPLPRTTFEDVPFTVLDDGMAAVTGYEQKMEVFTFDKPEQDETYLGSGFLNLSPKDGFAKGFRSVNGLAILIRVLTLVFVPFGTITSFRWCEELSGKLAKGRQGLDEESKESQEEIIELCGLMGSAAITSSRPSDFDPRPFRMMDPRMEGGLLHFWFHYPTEGAEFWTANTRIKFSGMSGVVTTAIRDYDRLRISARLSTTESLTEFQIANGRHFVYQQEMVSRPILEKNFYSELSPDSNGRKIIEATFTNRPLVTELVENRNEFFFPTEQPVQLDEYQSSYVRHILSSCPMTIGSSAFGCGKSTTMVTAAAYNILLGQETGRRHRQLLLAQSNFAVGNLVEIAQKMTIPMNSVRFITETNWNSLTDECRTPRDLPVLLPTMCRDALEGRLQASSTDLVQMALYLLDRNLIPFELVPIQIQHKVIRAGHHRRMGFLRMTELFFLYSPPELIFSTTDSVKLITELVADVKTVQVDEASQISRCALFRLLSDFPDATFGLVGDTRQLPPYADGGLGGIIGDLAVGTVMKDAIEKELFPVVEFRVIYRCHPTTTQLLGALFYSDRLISGTTADARSALIRARPDLFPTDRFPIFLIDNQSLSHRVGTSVANDNEVELVEKLLHRLLRPPVTPADVGVISFYKAQTNVLMERLRQFGVKVGTVDSFQGCEKELVVVCTTTSAGGDFLVNRERVNVAMSRAKQASLVVGYLDDLEKMNLWTTIVGAARVYGTEIKLE